VSIDASSRHVKYARLTLYRCGKSSVQKVVFEKMAPGETLYLDPTNKIERASMQYAESVLWKSGAAADWNVDHS
jgi:hypothetical protein